MIAQGPFSQGAPSPPETGVRFLKLRLVDLLAIMQRLPGSSRRLWSVTILAPLIGIIDPIGATVALPGASVDLRSCTVGNVTGVLRFPLFCQR